MPKQSTSPSALPQATYQQVAHIVVAGLWTTQKTKLIRHISETPLEKVDIISDYIPVPLPHLTMGQLRVDARLTAQIWGAPDQWRHDYVNYLVNIGMILNQRGDHHRVMGMIVVVDSLPTASSEDESKLVRFIDSDWKFPYIIVASHPYDVHARSVEQLRESYGIRPHIPIHCADVSQKEEADRALINLLYHAM